MQSNADVCSTVLENTFIFLKKTQIFTRKKEELGRFKGNVIFTLILN